MLNKSLLQQAVLNKFQTLTLHAIVNECFINGLPLDKESIEDTEKKEMTKYSLAVLESVGGFSALENALISADTDQKRILLSDIYTTCTEAASVAANRVVNATDCKCASNMTEIVDAASFTNEEYNTFIKKADSLNTEDISEIIQKKTMDVIKEEQLAYERDEKIENELTDALATSDDVAKESVSTYMNLVLDQGDPRHHVSLFSKIQEAACESIRRTTVDISTAEYLDIAHMVTFESFLGSFKKEKDVLGCLESLVATQKASECENTLSSESQMKLSTVVSIVVYTLFETLKTMNIYCPDKAEITKFVTGTSSAVNMIAQDKTSFKTQCLEMITSLELQDYSAKEPTDLSQTLSDLVQIKETLTTLIMNDASFLNARGDILDRLSVLIDKLSAILTERAESAKATESLGYYDKLNREKDVAQMAKIHNLFSKNANIQEIRFNMNPAVESSIIDVTCTDSHGQIIGSSFIHLNTEVDRGSICNYVKESFVGSKLAQTEKAVSICYTDGSAKKIKLK